MAQLSVTVTDRDLEASLAGRIERLRRPRPLLVALGEHLTESTRMRFRAAQAPDGTRWAPNTRTTIERYLAARGGYSRKTGRITDKGSALAMGKVPLTGTTRQLGSQIIYQADDTELLVGSNRIQAAVQQHGAAKGSLGGGAPWGDIPARPFLGLSAADRAYILEEVASYLDEG